MNTMDAAVALIAELDPAFRTYIQGAREEEIASLEALAGLPLPATYRDFLRLMGNDMDWLAVENVDFQIATLLEAYKLSDHRPPPGYLRIGIDRDRLRFDAYLEIVDGRVAGIVRFPESRGRDFSEILRFQLKRVAGSLEEMLCLPVFTMYRFDPLPFQARYRVRGEAASPLEFSRFASEEGFQWLWFSSPRAHAYERAGGALIIKGPERGGLTLKLAVRKPRELRYLGERLTSELGAVPLP